jgi:hypothetical protein
MTNEEKLDYIFNELAKGKDREGLAVELGYKNYKSMDIFVRRQGYTWDRNLQKYLLPEERNSGMYAYPAPTVSGKVGVVIKLFSKGEADPREVAKVVGFKDHRELAVYMRAKGYYWDDAIGNYKREEAEEVEEEQDEGELNDTNDEVENISVLSGKFYAGEYDGLLKFLLNNEDILRDLIQSAKKESTLGQIPRYAVHGIPVTKSIYMKNQLAQLVTDFSKEKNIKQNDIVEAALIEYFKKYGYKSEVETLLGI